MNEGYEGIFEIEVSSTFVRILLSDISITRNRETINISTLGDGADSKFITGMKQYTISGTIFHDGTNTGEDELEDRYDDGATVSWRWRPTGVADVGFKGTALVTDLSPSASTTDAVTLSLTLQGTGAFATLP